MSVSWTDRAADRSPRVQRSRVRSIEQARVIVDAALRLIASGAEEFTTQELINEAGVALQTFYRYFAGKDELLLAVLEDLIGAATDGFNDRASGLTDPVARLELHLTSVVETLATGDDGRAGARFVASEHWRLAKLFPDELAVATQPFTDLLASEVRAGCDAGVFRSLDPDRDAWLMAQMVLSVHHHYSFATSNDPSIAADLRRFCLSAVGVDVSSTGA
ncbi:MAG: TetR/AcrR family transcriptional regulator [Candidatus Aldehydirespiratoraceae bacterium]|jgi:TetR/AcrR family transcriptional regulator